MGDGMVLWKCTKTKTKTNQGFLLLKIALVSQLLVFLLYNFQVVYDLRDANTHDIEMRL